MKSNLAVDFGTTNSVVARWDETSAAGQTLDLPPLGLATSSGTFLIPTLLYVKDGQTGDVALGQEVRSQGLDRLPGNRLFRNFKRTIGAGSILEARIIDGAPWTDEQAGRIFLRRLLSSLPYCAEEIEQLVVTVPVAAFENYTSWLSRSLENLPAEKIRIVDESTAAALGYAITEPGAIVLVIDFGGGTLDLSLVRLPESREKTGKILFSSFKEQDVEKAQVLAKTGISLGGSDIDQWILQEALRRANISSEKLGAEYAGLLSACEKTKIELSNAESSTIEYSNIRQTFTRTELEALMSDHGFYTALKQALDKVMGLAHQKGVYREDIRHVLLVGGTSLIPSVQQNLDGFFRSITERKRKSISQLPTWPAVTWNVENTSIRVDKPFTAVVEGALQITAGFGIDDQLAHGYGLRVLDEKGSLDFDEIIPMGSSIPSRKPVSVALSASHSKQGWIEFVIGQINTDAIASVEVKYEDGQAYFVAQAGENTSRIAVLNAGEPLKVKLDPPGEPGLKRLRAKFQVDAARQLRLTVTDLKTRKTLLNDAVVASLKGEGQHGSGNDDPTGQEPSLAKQEKSGFRLPLKGLAAMLNVLPPDRIPIEVYAAALRSEDCIARFSAADVLARRGDREARRVFEDTLQTGTPPQRASVARHLYRFSWFVAEPLYRRALDDEDTRVREAAVFSLCRMSLPEAYALAIDVLRDGGDALKLAAVWGLSSHPDPACVPVLEVALQAQNPEIRELALEVLGATETPAAIPAAKMALRDLNHEVQYAATLSWIELARETCFAELAALISQTRGLERHALLRGFFHATNYMGIEIASTPDAALLIDMLEAAMNDELPKVRLSAFMPLCWIRHPKAESALLEGFRREADSDTKARMLAVAAHLMSPVTEKLLQEASQSADPVVRQTAEYLLKANATPYGIR